jgi:hypothetical protein
MKMGVTISSLSLLLLAFGCSSSSGGSGQGLSAADSAPFLGIYQKTTYAQNKSSCDASGVSSVDTHGDDYFLITDEDDFGTHVAAIYSCSGVSDCQAKRAMIAANDFFASNYSITLSSATNATTLTGVEALSGFPDGGSCTGRTFSDFSLVLNADHSVHLESHTKNLADKPQPGQFFEVAVAEALQVAASAACSTLTVLEGSFVQAM